MLPATKPVCRGRGCQENLIFGFLGSVGTEIAAMHAMAV